MRPDSTQRRRRAQREALGWGSGGGLGKLGFDEGCEGVELVGEVEEVLIGGWVGGWVGVWGWEGFAV